MDPLVFMDETDPFRRGIMQAIAAAADRLSAERDQGRANLIAGAVSKIFSKG